VLCLHVPPPPPPPLPPPPPPHPPPPPPPPPPAPAALKVFEKYFKVDPNSYTSAVKDSD
jgi:hypothetical protein